MSESTLEERAGQTEAPAGTGWDPGSIGALALGLVVLGVLFVPEFRAAVEVWDASTAYGHCYLIIPMTAYLLWNRRDVIRGSRPIAEWRWALLGLPIAAVWLAAERLGIMEGRQLAAIAGFELLFAVVLGWRLYAKLSGPLLYLVFLVPFGAFVTPALQHFTADFTVMGLRLFGIPYYSDSFIIETPSGTFLVAEACAGLRFLIAAVAFGVFYALVSYRSPARRAAYILLSLVVPIVANGFRAFGIVFLGQILGSAEAAAADHLIYGWIFFSIVMLMLVAVGHTFRETTRPVLESTPASPSVRTKAPVWSAVAALAAVGVGPAVAATIDRFAIVQPFAAEWHWASAPGCGEPTMIGTEQPDARAFSIECRSGAYRVATFAYSARSTSRAMVADRRRLTRELGAEDVAATSLDIGGASGDWTLVQTTEPDGVTAYASWVNGKPAEGGLRGRFLQARESLLGSTYQPVLITVAAVDPGRLGSAQRRDALAQIRALVAAQSGLNDRVEQISRIGSAP